MGMYDSIYLDLRCPNCGQISNMECQTKDSFCTLHVYKVGDIIPVEYGESFEYLNASASCRQKICLDWEKNRYQGRIIGFGFGFRIKIFLDKGRITNRVELYEQ